MVGQPLVQATPRDDGVELYAVREGGVRWLGVPLGGVGGCRVVDLDDGNVLRFVVDGGEVRACLFPWPVWVDGERDAVAARCIDDFWSRPDVSAYRVDVVGGRVVGTQVLKDFDRSLLVGHGGRLARVAFLMGGVREVVERLAEMQALVALLGRSDPKAVGGRLRRAKGRVAALEDLLRRDGHDPARLVRLFMRKRYDELVRDYRVVRDQVRTGMPDHNLERRLTKLSYKLDGFALCLFGHPQTSSQRGAEESRGGRVDMRLQDFGGGVVGNRPAGATLRRVSAPIGEGNSQGHEIELEQGMYAYALDVERMLEQRRDNFLLYALYLLRYSSVEGEDGTLLERADLKSGLRAIQGVGVDLEQRVSLLRFALERMYIFTVQGKKYLVDLDNAGVLHVIDSRGLKLEDAGLLRKIRRYVLLLRSMRLG